LLREVFEYQNSSDKKQTIKEAYSFVSKYPRYMLESISAMEKSRDKIREKLEKYRK